MWSNYNYFYKVTAPLHQHKTFKEQLESIDGMIGNMTMLSDQIDNSKSRLEGLEADVINKAQGEFEAKDRNINLS